MAPKALDAGRLLLAVILTFPGAIRCQTRPDLTIRCDGGTEFIDIDSAGLRPGDRLILRGTITNATGMAISGLGFEVVAADEETDKKRVPRLRSVEVGTTTAAPLRRNGAHLLVASFSKETMLEEGTTRAVTLAVVAPADQRPPNRLRVCVTPYVSAGPPVPEPSARPLDPRLLESFDWFGRFDLDRQASSARKTIAFHRRAGAAGTIRNRETRDLLQSFRVELSGAGKTGIKRVTLHDTDGKPLKATVTVNAAARGFTVSALGLKPGSHLEMRIEYDRTPAAHSTLTLEGATFAR